MILPTTFPTPAAPPQRRRRRYAVRSARLIGGGEIENDRGNFLPAVPARFSDVSLLRRVFSFEHAAAVFAVAGLGPSAHLHRLPNANADARHAASASRLHRDYCLAGSSCAVVQASHEPSPDQMIPLQVFCLKLPAVPADLY